MIQYRLDAQFRHKLKAHLEVTESFLKYISVREITVNIFFSNNFKLYIFK